MGTASGISRDPWHRGDPWHSLVWPLTPRALKCFTKAALAAPLCLCGAQRRRKRRRGGRSPRLAVLQQLRVPAEHSTGKCSWVPPGGFQCSPCHRNIPQGSALLGRSEKLPSLSLPCPGSSGLLVGLQLPKSSSTMKTKTNPKAVLLEQSWSQVLDKAQELLEQRGLSQPFPANPAGRLSAITPWLVPSPCQPLPALQSQPQQQQAGLRGRGRGKGAPGCCGAPRINSAPFPGRDSHREMQSLISGGISSSGLGSCMDSHSMGIQPHHPACSLTGRGTLLREGKGPEISRDVPERSLHFPLPQSPTCSGIQLLPPAPFPIHAFICLGYLCKK